VSGKRKRGEGGKGQSMGMIGKMVFLISQGILVAQIRIRRIVG